MSFFIQDLDLKFHSFLGFFQHGSGFSVKAIMPLNILVSNSTIVTVISKVSHTWIIFGNLTKTNGANIGFRSNSRDWLF